jgi:SNF2 family DNA or RNA helicase
MTDMKRMTAEEAAERLDHAVKNSYDADKRAGFVINAEDNFEKDKEALAVLAALAERCEKAEVDNIIFKEDISRLVEQMDVLKKKAAVLAEEYAQLESACYDGCATGDNIFEELKRALAENVALKAFKDGLMKGGHANLVKVAIERDALQALLVTELKRSASDAEEFRKVKAERDEFSMMWKKLKFIPSSERDEENAALKAEVERLTDWLKEMQEQRNSWATRAEKAEAELDAARPLAIAAEGLLAFIREKFPKDFEPGGHGYLCPHHRAMDSALTAYRAREGKGKP